MRRAHQTLNICTPRVGSVPSTHVCRQRSNWVQSKYIRKTHQRLAPTNLPVDKNRLTPGTRKNKPRTHCNHAAANGFSNGSASVNRCRLHTQGYRTCKLSPPHAKCPNKKADSLASQNQPDANRFCLNAQLSPSEKSETGFPDNASSTPFRPAIQNCEERPGFPATTCHNRGVRSIGGGKPRRAKQQTAGEIVAQARR